MLKALAEKYGVKGPEDVIAPVGTANAYDGMHLVALAIEQAGGIDGLEAARGAGESQGGVPRPHQDVQAALQRGASTTRSPTKTTSWWSGRAARSSPSRRSSAARVLVQLLVSGLALGSMYGLVALGYHMTWVTSRTMNFSQGHAVMGGAVVAYALLVGLGWPFPSPC